MPDTVLPNDAGGDENSLFSSLITSHRANTGVASAHMIDHAYQAVTAS